MKILITYASAGAGHFKAASAVYNYIKKHHEEIDVKIEDVLKNSAFLFRIIYAFGYAFLVKYASFIWAMVFNLTKSKNLSVFTRTVSSVITRLNTKQFTRLLLDYNPDFIISTHFLPSEISVSLAANQKIQSKVITVITDFGVHPFWVSQGTNLYIVASELTKQLAAKETTINTNIIRESGIPIDEKFTVPYEKHSLCGKFNINENKFIVLIMTGSFGIGPIEEIVDLLQKEDIEILAVCAKNKRLFEKLKNKNYPNVRVFGFINNVAELMSVSDVMVTKPGGSSIAELLSMALVPVFICAIPGQETDNARILGELGIGNTARTPQDVKGKVTRYLQHPNELSKIKEKIKQIRKPLAAAEICDVIRKGSI